MIPESDIETRPTSRPPTPAEKRWAVVRILLGTAQVMGATAILVFLVQTGMSVLTIVATAVTLFFTVLGRLLFSKTDRKD